MSFGSRSLGKPSAEQLRRWELMEPFGCIACWMQGRPLGEQCGSSQRHHLTVGGKHGAPRLGHDYTVMLGLWHHMGQIEPWLRGRDMEAEFGPSYAKTPKAFRREFGNDEHLLTTQNALIVWTKEPQRERVRRNGSPTARPLKSFRRTAEAKTLSEGATRTSPATMRKKKRSSRCQRPEKVIARGNRIV